MGVMVTAASKKNGGDANAKVKGSVKSGRQRKVLTVLHIFAVLTL